ncbi:RelA/SpoT domain-containing protein [Pontibacter sp. JH31]|uniref:RelA/SpoT domain-containing protein n=1 Tax=Pontibacter aquaedesilientis TaxID=2766980 RepID=A0ABR7XNM6_9BACT|nr:RelA/SpoT domain-containing protein [Pontibacter aquaedesilientis]MBD1399011.1 RelA/SpoT domain-containing protein [Pontibacter aquaedesilientis]
MPNHNQPNENQSTTILARLGIAEEEWHAQGIAPQTLVAIYHDFALRNQELTDIAAQTANTLQHEPAVHAVRYRVKDPVHLLRKIIRKKNEYPERTVDERSYLDWINDLVGIRVLYLYKESWREVGHFIKATWELKRTPIAYIGAEEAASVADEFTAAGCNIRRHDLGYRAVHFVISTQPNRQRYFAEIQLRTLFEEGWSEIDHNIRYPDHRCGAAIRELLTILNRLTSQSDQLASFTKFVLNTVYTSEQLTDNERSEVFAQLQALPISKAEKVRLHEQIDRLLTKMN